MSQNSVIKDFFNITTFNKILKIFEFNKMWQSFWLFGNAAEMLCEVNTISNDNWKLIIRDR